MHEPPGGASDDRQLFQRLLGLYDAPAFVRRVKRIEDADRLLAEHVGKKRAENLAMVRLRVGQLLRLVGTWDALRGLVASEESLQALRELHDELRPELRMPIEATRSPRRLRTALGELADAIEAFNRRWQKYIAEFDLGPLNKLREGYNKHYLIEKECALGNSRVARMGFKRLEPLTVADLLREFPLLQVPGFTE